VFHKTNPVLVTDAQVKVVESQVRPVCFALWSIKWTLLVVRHDNNRAVHACVSQNRAWSIK